MSADATEQDAVVEPKPGPGPKLLILTILSVLLGILLSAGAVGGYFFVQKGRDFELKVLKLDSSLKEKSQTIADLQQQIVVLSGQLHLLRDYAIARSTPIGEHQANAQLEAPPVTPSPVAESKSSDISTKKEVTEKAPSHPPAAMGKVEPPKVVKENCDLVGKSPEEQVETLRRCVALMDPLNTKPTAQ